MYYRKMHNTNIIKKQTLWYFRSDKNEKTKYRLVEAREHQIVEAWKHQISWHLYL
jgi:hypothetical protein